MIKGGKGTALNEIFSHRKVLEFNVRYYFQLLKTNIMKSFSCKSEKSHTKRDAPLWLSNIFYFPPLFPVSISLLSIIFITSLYTFGLLFIVWLRSFMFLPKINQPPFLKWARNLLFEVTWGNCFKFFPILSNPPKMSRICFAFWFLGEKIYSALRTDITWRCIECLSKLYSFSKIRKKSFHLRRVYQFSPPRFASSLKT